MASKSKWEVFFKEAGIPSALRSEYATAFSDNRMCLDMLDELSKELLADLGIKAVGDVIAILRHAKIRSKEMSRLRSSSTDDNDEVSADKREESKRLPAQNKPTLNKTAAPAAVAVKTSTVTKSLPPSTSGSESKPIPGPKLTIQAPRHTSSKSKEGRRKLSDRFDEYQRDIEKMKAEEQKQIKDNNRVVPQKAKPKSTFFTIQVPLKLPQAKTTEVPLKSPQVKTTEVPLKSPQVKITPKQQVTLVPAQGKPLNRSKQPSSIFDRLDNPTATKATPQMDLNDLKRKHTVFNRLGSKEDEQSSPSQKVQKVPAILRLDPKPPSNNKPVRTSSGTNVFNRLGDR